MTFDHRPSPTPTVPPPPARPRARARHRAAAALLAALTVAPLSACSASDAAERASGGERVLQVGQLGTAITEEALLAAAGEDENLGYSVHYSLFPSGPAFMEAVPSGAVDLATMADTPAIFAQVGKIPVKVVAVEDTVREGESTVEILARPGSGIESVPDLVGKKVAVLPATIMQYTVVRALEAEGLTYADITPVELPLADAVTALTRGDVDAIASLGATLEQARATGAVVVGDGDGITAGYSYVVATDAALADEQKAADVADYVARLGRARQWAVEHPAQWATTYAELTGLPLPIARAVIDRQTADRLPIDDAVIAAQQEQADVYTELGLVQSRLDVSLEFDDRLNDQVTGAAS